MASEGSVGLIAAIYGAFIASISAAIAVVTFWMKFEHRITVADSKADNAVQDAAEAKNETENLRDVILDKFTEIDKLLRQTGHEYGDALVALRQHHTELAFFVRDNFVRTPEFAAAMAELKAGQLRMEAKLDQMREKH